MDHISKTSSRVSSEALVNVLVLFLKQTIGWKRVREEREGRKTDCQTDKSRQAKTGSHQIDRQQL